MWWYLSPAAYHATVVFPQCEVYHDFSRKGGVTMTTGPIQYGASQDVDSDRTDLTAEMSAQPALLIDNNDPGASSAATMETMPALWGTARMTVIGTYGSRQKGHCVTCS